ncbi:MAG: 4Fe-4S binding protein [Desulfovibrionales bacterium]|nr:4Fe-4S binding protein [Desulfovibrionales bacterium]
MSKKKKGQTIVCVYPDWCKGCGLCVAFCPGKVLQLNMLGKAEVVQPDECLNCGFCEFHCPDFAITVRPKASNGVHCRVVCDTCEPCKTCKPSETSQKTVAEG